MKIIAAGVEHINLFAEHVTRLVGTSGIGSQPFFCPHDAHTYSYNQIEQTKRSWMLRFSEPGWSRAWLLVNEGKVLGHLNIKCKPFQSSLHRCDLGMGLEAIAQGQGYSQKLLDVLFKEALKIPNLEYIDLQVFDCNPVALRLYEKNGFELLGKISDAFRFGDKRIDDIFMAKKIKAP